MLKRSNDRNRVTDSQRDREAELISRELNAFRLALRQIHLPQSDEESLRKAIRGRAEQQSSHATNDVRDLRRLTVGRGPRATNFDHGIRRFRARISLVAGGTLAACLAVFVVYWVGGDPSLDPAGTVDSEIGVVPSSDAIERSFQPLAYSPEPIPSQVYNIVRVRIPVSVAVGAGRDVQTMVVADLLIGEDGLAAGIRLRDPASWQLSGR